MEPVKLSVSECQVQAQVALRILDRCSASEGHPVNDSPDLQSWTFDLCQISKMYTC